MVLALEQFLNLKTKERQRGLPEEVNELQVDELYNLKDSVKF